MKVKGEKPTLVTTAPKIAPSKSPVKGRQINGTCSSSHGHFTGPGSIELFVKKKTRSVRVKETVTVLTGVNHLVLKISTQLMCHYILSDLSVDINYLSGFTLKTRSGRKYIQFTDNQGTIFALKVISATDIVFEVRMSK